MSTETNLPPTLQPRRKPKRAILFFGLAILVVTACIFSTICTRKKLKKAKNQFESELARIDETVKRSSKAQEDLEKAIFHDLKIFQENLKTLMERNEHLEEQNRRLADELISQNGKISQLEAKNLDLIKYEKLIHGSMQKNDFALYNDIYLETFRGLLPIAEGLENLSNQLAASSNNNPESLELLRDLKTAHAEHVTVLNNGQEIIQAVLKSEHTDIPTSEGIKEEESEKVINGCQNDQGTLDDPIYHYGNETIPGPFEDVETNTESRESSKEILAEIRKKVQDDLIVLGGLAKDVLQDAKENFEDVSEEIAEKSKSMGEKLSEAGRAIKEKSGEIAKNAAKKMQKASEEILKKAGELSNKVKKIMTNDKFVDARLKLAKGTTEMVGKARKVFRKLFG